MSTRFIFQTNFTICSDRPKTSQYYTMAQFEIKDGIAIIPEGTTCIEREAFLGCTSLESVTIPESVTEIGDNAFSECRKLTACPDFNFVTGC